MDKNKSIDGLVSRRSKSTPHHATPKNSTPKKAKSTKSSKIAKTPKSTPVKTTKTPKTTKSISSTPIPSSQNNITSEPNITTIEPNNSVISDKPLASTDDFLKPVQAFNFDEQSKKLEAATPTTPIEADQDNPDDKEKTKNKKPKKAKKKMSKKRKIILSIIISLISIILLGGICLILWGNDIIAKITGGQGNVFDLLTFLDDNYEPLKADKNGRTNILAFGTSGYNMEGDEGNGTHDGAQLTDSIMAISLDQETGDIAMLSLPRDLKVPYTCTSTSKINEVYWCNNMDGNNEQAGAEALMETVGDILGIDFQYYSHLNWGSLVQIVDTLGGITVTLDEDINDYYYTGSVYEAGVPYTIDGIHAVALSRARHGTSSGDFSRGASQQKILIGIKDKVLEKSLSISDIVSLASTLGDNLRTNFSVEEMKTLAHFTSEFDLNNIRQVSLIEPEALVTTGEINGISYVLPTGGANYYTRIQNYVAKMFSSDPRSYEDASILVLNGTGTPGIASTEQASLESDGYDNIDIDNAPTDDYTDHYTLYSLTNDKPGTKKLLEEKYNQSAKSITDLPAGISQFYDFVIIVGETPSTDTEE